MKNLLVVHGPNLNLLGEREPEIYGSLTLDALNDEIRTFAGILNLDTRFFQSNSEGALIDCIHENRGWAEGLVINPGALTHYSYALRDAIVAVNLPTVEVHLSDIEKRESFRRISVIREVALQQIKGLGSLGYLRAVEALVAEATAGKIQAAATELEWDPFLKEVVKLLAASFSKYTWVGIYLVEGEELVLHNFHGKPSPHTRIPIGRGICGAAVAERASIVVADVNSDPRYLACSIETKSEIVVPIFAGDNVIGEIDIDSDLPDSFHDGDRGFLEDCAKIIGLHQGLA